MTVIVDWIEAVAAFVSAGIAVLAYVHSRKTARKTHELSTQVQDLKVLFANNHIQFGGGGGSGGSHGGAGGGGGGGAGQPGGNGGSVIMNSQIEND